jgi:predicted transcriptional regulator
MPSKRYKDYRFYAFVVLNFITSTLDIHIFQKGLEGIITPILENQDGVSKSSIMYEINSNHNMTNKVLDYLVEEKLIKIDTIGSEYKIIITKKGIFYLREYSRFYMELFKTEIAELYKYRAAPSWYRGK